LLRSGKIRMAMTVLEGLPRLFRSELTDAVGAASWRAYGDGLARGRASLAAEIAGLRQRPKQPTRLDWLRAKVADQPARARALAALRLDDRLLDRVLTGSAQLSPPHSAGATS
jgi:hypothetical protein